MNILKAKDGYLLTNGEQYVKEVATFGDVSMWREVPESERPSENDADLQSAKAAKVSDIEAYDVSENVNAFAFGGVSAWIAKADRVGLANSLAIEQRAGHESTTMWFNGHEITLPIAQALQMLDAIELYALECYNVTARHKAEVAELATIVEVDAYDITADYPNKLSF